MSTFTDRLDVLEARLQIFIEGRLARLSPLGGGEYDLAHRLVSAMRAGAISTGDGILLAPDRFTVLVHPSRVETCCADPETLAELGNLLQEIGKNARLHFLRPPVVTVAPNEDVSFRRVDVITRFSDGMLTKTRDLEDFPDDETSSIPPNAFLIVNGIRIFPLDQAVINIGRRSINDLVIDDPRVSRQHAQIRASRGRFEIFDLDSTGGVFVNQQRVERQVLYAGDVISLAGFPLIYGQETSLEKTREMNVSAGNG
jgi:hypothetical protein